MKLWIDDVRAAPPGWIWAKSSAEALAILGALKSKHELREVSFDHDLGGDDTSRPVATFIEEEVIAGRMGMPMWWVHSANPVGRIWLIQAMQSAEERQGRGD